MNSQVNPLDQDKDFSLNRTITVPRTTCHPGLLVEGDLQEYAGHHLFPAALNRRRRNQLLQNSASNLLDNTVLALLGPARRRNGGQVVLISWVLSHSAWLIDEPIPRPISWVALDSIAGIVRD